jgi:hypothetical protein
MKSKSVNYIFPLSRVFNPEEVPLFETLDKEHSAILWGTLYINIFEVVSSYSQSFILIVDEKDRDFLPGRLSAHYDNILFGNIDDREALLRNLNEKYFSVYENNIVFFSNTIGYTHQDISKTQNLLNLNDDALVLAKSAASKICFAGFNTYPDFLEKINLDYDNVLAQSCRYNSYIYLLENYMSVDSLTDFKKLYNELSKKESTAYCSQEMHELFTHLFIEYKDLLK